MSSKISNEFSGAESFLVGIAPNYWAHVPMTISDVKALRLVEGTYCVIFPEKENSVPNNEAAGNLVPIQKCYLVGFIVNIHIKSNDSVLYVLDDGTGLIDCIDWNNQGFADELSLLLGDSDQSCNKFKVGDLVCISGKIQCKATIGPEEILEIAGKQLNLRQTIFDVQITNIDHATETSPIYLNAEARHWISCNSSVIAPTSNFGTGLQQSDMNNANDFLELLGPKAQYQVRNQQNLPASEDKLAAWRVFGPSCRCSVQYMDSLLYCHCQAKHEPLDPAFRFRDEVLEVLLNIEHACGQARLEFKYKDVVCNDRLAQMATSMVTGNSANPFLSANRLFVSTFQALRSDGIIYLLDADSDTYLLVSRSRVLEPYVKEEMVKLGTCTSPHKILESAKKPFLSKVHNERLLFIRRALAASDPS